VGVGPIFLNRDLGGNQVFVNDQMDPGGTTLIQSDDYDLGTYGGPYVDIIRHGTYCDVQARYWQIDGWSATVGPVSAPNGAVYRFDPPILMVGLPSEITSTYTSDLRSFELNLRRRFKPRCTGLIGFRTLELDDLLTFDSRVADAFDTHAALGTQNRLYGLQLGLEGTVYQHNRFSIEAWARGGAFANNSKSRATYSQPGGSAAQVLDSCDLAFAGDAGIWGVYQFCPCLSIRLGYQAFWMDGVTTASGQMSRTSPIDGPYIIAPPRKDDDSVFAHGVTLAVEYYWCGHAEKGGKGKGYK